MAETLKAVEGLPASYPAVTGLSVEAAALDASVIWQRIEGYIARRWTLRSITWTVEGDGDWTPPLTPATIATVEEWAGTAWAAAILPASPLGGNSLPGLGPYRFAGTVGAGTPPAAVLEAFRRLAEYSVEAKDRGGFKGRPGATSTTFNLGSVTRSFERAPNWVARAMINSGADSGRDQSATPRGSGTPAARHCRRHWFKPNGAREQVVERHQQRLAQHHRHRL